MHYNVHGSKLESKKYKFCKKKNICICRREMYRMYFGKEIFQFFVPKIE